jgi:hypothetical protein
MKIKRISKALINGGLSHLGKVQELELFIIPPSGRVLAIYDHGDSDRITGLMRDVLLSGGILIPLQEIGGLIAALIGSLTPDEHQQLAERLIESIK